MTLLKNGKTFSLIVFLLTFLLFLYPYLGQTTYFPIGWDGGHYYTIFLRYLETKDLFSVIDYWYEPGFFFSLTFFTKITNINGILSIKIFTSFLFILKTLSIFILLRKVIHKIPLYLIVFLVFFSFSINYFYLFIFKQYFAEIFFILTIFVFFSQWSKSQIIFLISIFSGFVFYSHRGITMGLGVLCFIYSIYIWKNKNKLYTFIIGLFGGIMIYLPLLIFILPLEINTLKDFLLISKENFGNLHTSFNGASIIDPESREKNQIFTFIYFNTLIWIIPLSFLNRIKYSNTLKHPTLILSLTYIFLLMVHYKLNFSSRFTSIVFIFLIILFSSSFIFLKNKIIKLLAVSLIIIFGIQNISTKRFYIKEYDSETRYFETKVPKDALIISGPAGSLLPSYLGYLQSYHPGIVSLELSKFTNDIVRYEYFIGYTNYILTHPHAPLLPTYFADKEIYVIIGLFYDGSVLTNGQKIQSHEFYKSIYFENIISLNKPHPLKHVFRLKRELLKKKSMEENLPLLYQKN